MAQGAALGDVQVDAVLKDFCQRTTRTHAPETAGIGLYASSNSVVANNTIVNAANLGHAALYFGVTFQDYEPGAGRPANNNPFIRNNLVIQSGQPCMSIRYSDELGGLSGLSGSTNSNYNAFYNTTGGGNFTDSRPMPGEFSGNLAGWRTRTAGDASSIETTLTLTADGHLPAGSAAINAGQTLNQVNDDFDQQTRVGAVDIGADEVVAPVVPVACDLDLDGNGRTRAKTDGLLLRRYVVNIQPGVDLTQHLRAPGGDRPFAEIQSRVEAMRATLAIDMDGDGVVNEKDTTLVLRALLGFSGSAATAGLSFVGSARADWSAIRLWLNTECALGLP